jgi:tetraacyldisaccharide 4'-kinase
VLSRIYRRVARQRRLRYEHGTRQQRLGRPVVSVGNLAVGGRGKTPVVAAVAGLLLEAGERPAILSRGYGRTDPTDTPVVVSDGRDILADLPRAGDEPLMLARRLPGCRVVVAPDRYLAGRLAESALDATVHLLDDGFQHLRLARDVDLVIVAAADLAPDARTLPLGRLREGVEALASADAVLLNGATADRLPPGLRAAPFTVHATAGALRSIDGAAAGGGPWFAVAGIAAPERFVEALRRAGHAVVGMRTYRDHHPYTASDVGRIVATARQAGAAGIVTTEKDAVRLLPFRPFPLPMVYLPLTMDVEPAAAFRRWLLDALRTAGNPID